MTIFIHIPKTAGTTFKQILNDLTGRDCILEFYKNHHFSNYLEIPIETRERGRILLGHTIRFDTIRQFGLKNEKVVTFLRSPENQVVSQYHAIIRNKGHRLHDEFTRNAVSIEEFVLSGKYDRVFSNLQGRYVCDQGDRGSTAQIVNSAKKNLSLPNVTFGITERFEESLLLMKVRLGWGKYPTYNCHNVTKEKKGITQVALNRIRELNHADIEIYSWASKVFDERISELSRKGHKLN